MIAISSKCNLPNFVVTIHVFLGGMKEQNIGGKVHIQQECIGMQDTWQCSTATEKKKYKIKNRFKIIIIIIIIKLWIAHTVGVDKFRCF